MPETITLGRLDGEVRQTLAAAGIDPRHASIVLHKPLEREHAKNRRRYAQCIPDELVFEFATATLVLDDAHRSALIAHEVGHCIAWRERGDHGEDDADEAAERVLGVSICYDQAWPGKGLQVDCRMQGGVKRIANPRPNKRGWPKQGTPPTDPRAYVRHSDLDAAYRAQYVQGDTVIASSRTKKAEYPRFELGTWRIDDEFRGMYGHEIDELVLVDDPRVLEPGEFDWSDPTKMLRQSGKLEDMERYAQWMADGHSYPPIQVVETERGTLRITDGHRRAAAADSMGLPVRAWVSWLTDHPDPPRDQRGNIVPMSVGLTYELATGQEFPMSKTRMNPSDETHATRYMELGYRQRKPGLWRIVALDTDNDVGPHYRTKRDLLKDLDDYAETFGATPRTNPRGAYRETPVAIIKRDIGRANALLSRPDAGQTRWDALRAAAGFLADARSRFDKHGGSAALKRDLEEAEAELQHQGAAWDDEDAARREVRYDIEDYFEGFDENPKGPPFTPAEVEEIREDIGNCVATVADRRKLSAKYDEIAASEEVVPVRMKLTRRGVQQADLFGNPRAKNPLQKGDIVRLVGTPKWWRQGDPIQYRIVDVRPRAREPYLLDNGRWVGLGMIVIAEAMAHPRHTANPRRRNLQHRELKYDGPIARSRHAALRAGSLVPSASVADAGTGAYMALIGTEIFHVDTDGFVYVIGYDSAAEANDDYDYLLGKFPKLMNPRKANVGKFPALPRGTRFTKHGHFELATVPVETRTSYQGSQETVSYKPVKKKRDADTLVVYWKSGAVAGVVDAEENSSGKYTARKIWEGERLRPFGRQYDSLDEALTAIADPLRNPRGVTRKRNPLTWTKVGEHADHPIYESNVVETGWGHGVIRLDPKSEHRRGAYRLVKFGKKPAYTVAFYEIADPNEIPRAPGYWTWGSNVKRLSASPLVLEDAKRAGELWLENKMFQSENGRITSVTNPSRAPQRWSNPAPRAAMAAKRIAAL